MFKKDVKKDVKKDIENNYDNDYDNDYENYNNDSKLVIIIKSIINCAQMTFISAAMFYFIFKII